jgi:hypothetical protein
MIDFLAENLALALYGTTSAVTAAAVADESITAPSDLGDGDRLVETAFIIDKDETVTVTTDPSGTTYTEDTDYTVTSSGIVILTDGSISASDALLITYTKKAVDVIEGFVQSAQEYALVFDGLNEAQSNDPVVIRAHRVKFAATGGASFIANEFANMPLSGKCLKDTTITTSGLSQYLKISQA